MDFMKLLKSIEELLYELITWFVFYPLTLWRIVRHPITMLTYAQNELMEKDDDQFDDAVSPPVLLLLTLVMLHMLESAINSAWAAALPSLLRDDRNLLIARALLFSLFPLLYATVGLRARHARVTRKTLKPAFYSQSYATVPLVLSLSLGLQFVLLRGAFGIIGWMILAMGAGWYLSVQTVWFARSDRISRAKSFTMAAALFLGAIVLGVIVGAAVSLTAQALPAPA